MTIEAHIDSLAKKREELKEMIAHEIARPSPDFTLVTNWKKENLTLKQEMHRYFLMLKKQAAAS